MFSRVGPAILALAMTGCMGDGGIGCKGQVLTDSGEPLANAHVFLDIPARVQYHGFETNTDASGRFALSEVVAPGRYTIPLVVEAAGFKPARIGLPTLVENVVEIRLARTGSDVNSTAVIR